MFSELLFFYCSSKIGISYKVKKTFIASKQCDKSLVLLSVYIPVSIDVMT